MVQIKVGTIVHGISGNYIETAYTEDVLDWLKLPGSSIDVRERMITVYAIPIGRGIGLGLANLIWESVTPKDMFVYGDYIHG